MKTENRQQFLIIATIAVVALFVGERFVFEPLLGWWKERSAKIVELRKQVSNGNMMKQREQGIRSHWEQMRTAPPGLFQFRKATGSTSPDRPTLPRDS